MKNDDEIIELLIAGGIVGAALGALLSKKKGEGAALGALVGAAILGTYKASERAKETHVAMIVEENGKLYEIGGNGTKKFVRDIEKSNVKLKKHFKLE